MTKHKIALSRLCPLLSAVLLHKLTKIINLILTEELLVELLFCTILSTGTFFSLLESVLIKTDSLNCT